MSAQDNSIPAFPLPLGNQNIDPSVAGMTLLDYFAAQAMLMKFGPTTSSMEMRDMAKHCYTMARAMLEARK